MAPSSSGLSSDRKSLAIVSGKGGSGKTLVATAIAQGLALCDLRVLLVDADVGTGGLSYYLGFSAYSRARNGLTEFVLAGGQPDSPFNMARARDEVIQFEPAFSNILLMPVGEHRLFYNQKVLLSPDVFSNITGHAFNEGVNVVIFDCRGGIDEESLAVCQAVDEILMVVETDAASIQSSQHLVNILSEQKLANKLAGFALNKVLDDPSSLAKAGISFFRTDFLGAIPFDIETTRNFIKGFIPDRDSLFCTHSYRVAAKLFPGLDRLERSRVLSPQEFGTVTLRNPDARLGGVVITFAVVAGIVGIFVVAFGPSGLFRTADLSPFDRQNLQALIGVAASVVLLALFSLSDRIKSSVGRAMRLYLNIYVRFFRRERY